MSMQGTQRKSILELSLNGDPLGSGFTAKEWDHVSARWFYRGDLGAQTRAFWRSYAKQNGYTLREVRTRREEQWD